MYTSKDGKMMDLKEAINLHAFLLLYTPIWLQDFRISFRSLIIALHDYYGTYPRPAFEEKDWLPDYNDLNDDQIEDINKDIDYYKFLCIITEHKDEYDVLRHLKYGIDSLNKGKVDNLLEMFSDSETKKYTLFECYQTVCRWLGFSGVAERLETDMNCDNYLICDLMHRDTFPFKDVPAEIRPGTPEVGEFGRQIKKS